MIWTYIFSEVWDRRPHWECQWQLFWSPNYGMCRLSKLQKYNTVHKNARFWWTVDSSTGDLLQSSITLGHDPINWPFQTSKIWLCCLPHIKEPNEPLNCCVFYEQYFGFVTNDKWHMVTSWHCSGPGTKPQPAGPHNCCGTFSHLVTGLDLLLSSLAMVQTSLESNGLYVSTE